ncbi:4-alpha-glucanotransferase [Catenuloplanes atrovinosus]|uniref:4-alpha-glucanotransferase n=1 Tax=Catenuloplanes atrovinosus TaxID=137266 RepID=A0AAE3YW00_9ACTN|nr:4-alpha-glucanotransferase [Catenuloplanes atrovinosus]MDR7280924.1 4-alpha-glucanotransferase [Catenuloplanes atrovinosus]
METYVNRDLEPDLVALAEAHGVATWYENWRREPTNVSRAAVTGTLRLLGVDASTPDSVAAALAEVRAAHDPRRLPATVVLRASATRALPSPGTITFEDGSSREVTGELPAGLPLGWHRLTCAGQDVTLVVVPDALPEAPRAWGWMLQLYAMHSAESWGMGDFGDLRTLASWSGESGAGLTLLNPLHAPVPVHPVPSSPYSPSSRRFWNPLYLRISDVPGYQDKRAEIDALRPALGDLIDYDEVWRAKRAALELLFPLSGYAGSDDQDLRGYATYCAIAEVHGANWREWPTELRHPAAPAVVALAAELRERVAFHCWLQELCKAQLAAANDAAAAAGMPVGIVHDLAVGIDPGGADGWMLQDVLAAGVHAGAPPDAFNQLGQDWGLAAWRPDQLVATGYRAYREMLRGILRYAGGLRVDHVAGLWRLWWVLPGAGPADGTYVTYDPEAMAGILALEAHRAGAVVIGEDLGTVLPIVTRGLQRRNMLGSAVMWFARDPDAWADGFIPLSGWQPNALASISTHDLPTAAGFLTEAHIGVRSSLELLAGPVAEAEAEARRDRGQLVALLRENGFLPPEPAPVSVEEIIVAMHEALAATPCRLVVASPYDVLGEPRQPNLPGTVDQYPNWRIPLPATLEEFRTDPRVERIIKILNKH